MVKTYTYSYDDFDRVLTITDSHGPDTINVYEDKGAVSRLLSRTITDGNTSQTTEFEYDERDRVTKVTDAMGRETTTVYDLLGTGCRVQEKQ